MAEDGEDFLSQLDKDISSFAQTFTGVKKGPDKPDRFDVAQLDGFLADLRGGTQAPAAANAAARANSEAMSQMIGKAMGLILATLEQVTDAMNQETPVYPGIFVIAPPHCLDKLRWKSGRASCRMADPSGGVECYEYVLLGFQRETGVAPQLVKDIPLCYRFRELLVERGVAHESREIRKDGGVVVSIEFDISNKVSGSLFFRPDYTTGIIELVTRNINDFQICRYRAQARDIDRNAMERLAAHVRGSLRELPAPFIRIKDPLFRNV